LPKQLKTKQMEYKEITLEAMALVEKAAKLEPIVKELEALYQTLQRTEEAGKFTITAAGVNLTITSKSEMFQSAFEIATRSTWDKIKQLEKAAYVIMYEKGEELLKAEA
jgi:hypothetical protein